MPKAPIRVLYYNWVDYLDAERRGGGVTTYQRNLMEGWRTAENVSAVFLSSGVAHDFRANAPRWHKLPDVEGAENEDRFEIVNSGVLAPSHHDFGNSTQISHAATAAAFRDFIEQVGPFDVVHFNNLEGLPAEVLHLKDYCPNTRIVLSAHNYYPLCPQVNLWWNEEAACENFQGGQRCVTCLPHRVDRRLIRIADALSFWLKNRGFQPGSAAFDMTFAVAMRAGKLAVRTLGRYRSRRPQPAIAARVAKPDGSAFATRRDRMVGLINENCDAVLAVSERVAQIYKGYGIDNALVRTEMIGTSHAARYARSVPRTSIRRADGTVTLGYLGYMRRDKGFAFLMRALAHLPVETARRVSLVVAARRGSGDMMAALARLDGHLRHVRHIDGYSAQSLDDVLRDVDLGVVPVMWEDNLPQVAIEMHARRIPLMTSNMGGAKELCGTEDMVFKAGDLRSFTERLEHVLNGGPDMESYWANARPPVSMAEHLDRLEKLYRTLGNG